jgi:HPt (histidine-containing phosphotransfer) domain-containing protein
MAASNKAQESERLAAPSEVFDRAHLARYTMDSAELEREIIELFLVQLPATVDMIEEAKTAAEWKLATHTLKGAAAAIGAWRIHTAASGLEDVKVDAGARVKRRHMSALDAAVTEFRAVVRQILP